MTIPRTTLLKVTLKHKTLGSAEVSKKDLQSRGWNCEEITEVEGEWLLKATKVKETNVAMRRYKYP